MPYNISLLAVQADWLLATEGTGGFHCERLVNYKLGINQNNYMFTSKSLINIVLCSKFHRTKSDYKCFHMRSVGLALMAVINISRSTPPRH